MLLVALSFLIYDSVYVRNYSVIHLIIILVPFVSPVFSLVLNLRVLILITIVFKSLFYKFSIFTCQLFIIPRIYLLTFASLWVYLSSHYKSSQGLVLPVFVMQVSVSQVFVLQDCDFLPGLVLEVRVI